ncbi:PAS domain S-box protein [Jatrophihabitans sp.]|uniref:PAS domain S-box protein n=1 Tax=Jatrophihabitans sp. TaxID=1932789 RepID=UPI002C58BD0D|nr:PAS domain S-box protein [Jatrophihabitans sp.]
MAAVSARLSELADDALALLGAAAVAVRVFDRDGDLEPVALAGRNAAALVAGPDEPVAPARGRWRRREHAGAGEVESHPILSGTGRRLGWLTFERGASAEPSSRLAETALRLVLAQAAAVLEHHELAARVSAQDDLLLDRLDQLRTSEQALRVAFEESVVGMAMLSLDAADPGRCLRANDALCRLTGRPREELVTGEFERFTHPDDRGPTASAMRRAMAGRRTPFRTEKRLLRADGSSCWVRVTTTPLFDDDDRPLYALAQVEDLSQRAEREVEFAARLDPLTGTLNSAALEQGLVETVQRAHRIGTGCAVLVAELAGWQELAGGDQQLADRLQVALARRLQTTLRGSDVISRVGDNQFVIIAEEVGPEQAEAVAGRLEQALAVPESIDGRQFPMAVNLGLSVLSDGPGDDAGQSVTLLAQARTALEQSRAGGGSHVLYLSDGARPAVATSRTLYAHPDWLGRPNR